MLSSYRNSRHSKHMSEIYDEASYVKYAESVIFDLQRCFRSKPGFDNVPVIEMSAMLEEVCFHQALLDNPSGPPGDCLWLKKECIFQYQHRCEKMLRNLDAKERNWKKILEENEKNAKMVLSAILKDDEGGRRKIENPYRPPKPPKPAVVRMAPAERLKNLTSSSSKSTAAARGKMANKKGAIGKRKAEVSDPSSAGLLNASIDWNQLGGCSGGSLGMTSATYIAPVNTSSLMLPNAADMLMTVGEDDFNLDMFDDDASNVVQLSNPEAWQAPTQGQDILVEEEAGGKDANSGQVWRSAIAERESTVNREKVIRNQRDSQQDVIRKAREDGVLIAAARREEDEYASRGLADREKKERAEAQQQRDQARERERKAREEAEMTVHLDNDRDLLDE